jgi:hypothetical protein
MKTKQLNVNLIEIMTNVISDQIKHNSELKAEGCYNEITEFLSQKMFKGFDVVNKVYNPDAICKTENFQFVCDTQNKEVQIINKYF